MHIMELLGPRMPELSKKKVKMLRHTIPGKDAYDLHLRGHLETYQSFQGGDKALDCDFVISFTGMHGTLARFIGVYKVGKRSNVPPFTLPDNYPYPELINDCKFHYVLTKCSEFKDLAGRIVIDWGKSTLSWHQHLKDKEVVEILPEGYVMDFPGFLNVELDWFRLKEIIDHPIANRVWHQMLGSVAGIYVILDTKTGQHYIGSAYGKKEGLLGRWRAYAKNGHGDNVNLKKLIRNDPKYYTNFQYSILHTLSMHTNEKEVIDWETCFKRKLGTRTFGLNDN